ncbi:MAG: glutathione S-transferase family protein [Myxococcota bacterium]|jgi:GSH-dependent disulfide-bond oxidoreductase|nr:glutathione S-transferase family protein [Myxococcota bacterium]
MLKLYTWTTPNGRKISIALEELGLDYEVVPVNTGEREQFSDTFLAINPNHKIPAIEDNGQAIWESGAILLHLGEEYDPEGLILSKDPRKRLEAIQYAFFQTGGVGPNLGRLGAALRKEGEKNQEMIEIFGGEMDRLCGVIDRILENGDRDYLAGEYSIGDIMHFPWLRIAQGIGADWVISRPRVVDWLERIAARPAVERGMAIPAH